jgi:outer membrane lipoprotein-sorting protein
MLAGTRILSNGSTTRIYTPRTDTVVVRNNSRQAGSTGASGRSGLFLGLDGVENVTFEGNETLAGEDAVELSYAVQGSEVSLVLAGGQRTSRLSAPNGSDGVNVTVWIDRDRWLPLQARMNVTGFEEPLSYTVRYENVTVDGDIPDERFELDAEGADRAASMFEATIPGNGTSYTSYDALAAEAGPGLPPETLPGNVTFRQGFGVGEDGPSFYQLVYRGTAGTVQVQYVEDNVSVVSGDETTTVDGLTVETTRMRSAQILEYHCGSRTYLLIGSDRAVLLEVVEAIGCP